MNMEPAASAPPKGIWGIIGDVFFSPVQAFEAFKKKPNLWVPLILTIILAGAAGFFTAVQSAQDQYNMMQKSTTLPPQVMEEMRQKVENPARVGGAFWASVMVVAGGLVITLIAWFFGGFLFGGKAKFLAIWSTGLLAGLINMVGGLFRIPLIIAKGTAEVSIGPAALLPQTDYVSILKAFLTFADVFAIWSIVVLAIGYSVIFGISRGKGAMAAIISWIIVVGCLVGLMIFGLSFAGVEMRMI